MGMCGLWIGAGFGIVNLLIDHYTGSGRYERTRGTSRNSG